MHAERRRRFASAAWRPCQRHLRPPPYQRPPPDDRLEDEFEERFDDEFEDRFEDEFEERLDDEFEELLPATCQRSLGSARVPPSSSTIAPIALGA
jgi:hypothetical protein